MPISLKKNVDSKHGCSSETARLVDKLEFPLGFRIMIR